MSIVDKIKRKEIIKDLAEKLISEYAFPETGSKMVEVLCTKIKSNAYEKITSTSEFGQLLTDDLYNVAHDKHLKIFYSNDPFPTFELKPPSKEEIERVRKTNGGIEKLEILDSNIGYIKISVFPIFEGTKDTISAAFEYLHNTDALIIDNRENIGGFPKTVAWYMSYLSKGAPYLINTFHWRKDNKIEESWTTDIGDLSYGTKKPVFVLTSNATFSGGEELTYIIQSFKRGLVIGAVTGGGANIGSHMKLVHDYYVKMPCGYPVNPVTGSNWEGIGVKPDIEVVPEEALNVAYSLAI